MRFLCTQENLNYGLTIVGHIANKNTNLPILNNVLLKTQEGGVRLITTNLEIGVSCLIRGKVEEEGEFTLPARVLSEYVSLLPKEKVSVAVTDGQATINAGSHETKIKGEPAGDFPVIPTVERTKPIIVSPAEFQQAIGQVIFAASLSESRPEISGVLLWSEPEAKKVTLVATDSYRLAERAVACQSDGVAARVIIPARTLQEVQRILGNALRGGSEAGDKLEIYLTANQVLFVYRDVELVSRVIDGQYPEYQQIIPTAHTTQIIVGVEDLVKATKSASLFVKSGINDVSLEIRPAGELVISSMNSQVGESVQTVPANISGDKTTLVLNYRYLLDGLGAAGSSEVVVEATDNNAPAVIRPVLSSADDGVDRNYLYLIMPIKQ